jgi:hypothetical protein
LNPRPLEPHSSALPSCATARSARELFTKCQELATDDTDYFIGVLAAQNRAGQRKYYEVKNAAAHLKAMIATTMETHAQR